MLGNQPYYHKTLRKIVSVFGTLFNDVQVVRSTNAGAEVERINVPLAYGPSQRFLERLKEDPKLNKPSAIQLPRMSFTITSFSYDGNRKLRTTLQNKKVVDSDTLRRQYTGVAYNLGMELVIMAKNNDDANQILEQIIPFFAPDRTETYIPIPELGFKEDLPIILDGVTYSDNYSDDWTSRRNVVYTLLFTIQTFFYGPVKEQGVIKEAEIDIHNVASAEPGVSDQEVLETPRHVRVNIKPDPITADADDNFGYDETITEFDDGKKYNPVTDTDEDI